MIRKLVVGLLVCGVLAGGANLFGLQVASAEPVRQGGGIFYESRPDEVALYLSDIAFVRDRVILPLGQEIRVLLPPGTYTDTLILRQDGQRIRSYRITPLEAGAVTSSSYPGRAASVLTWETPVVTASAAPVEIELEYLLPGASWTPTYDMQVVDEENVALAFFAEIRNSALSLDEAQVVLVAGRVDLTQQLDQVPMVTANQYAVGYEPVEVPGLGAGALDLQHIYVAGPLSAQPGDTLYVSLAAASLNARREVVWDAAVQQETDVIYKVRNTTDLPLAEGIVRVYQDDLFQGSDFIETTPVGSEGSVTIGSLPDVRVRRSESREYQNPQTADDHYLYQVTLEIMYFSEDDLALLVLDQRVPYAWEFVFSDEPAEGQDNQLRWEITVPAGETRTISYSFRAE